MAKKPTPQPATYPSIIIKGQRYEIDSIGFLDVSNQGLHDLSEIEGLDRVAGLLKEVNLSHNHLTSIDALAGCTKLERLDISHNQLIQIDIIAHLKNLVRLDAQYNKITRLPALDDFIPDGKKYAGFYNFSHNEIETVIIRKDIGVRSLGLGFNRITDASWIWNIWVDMSDGTDPDAVEIEPNPLTAESLTQLDQFKEALVSHDRAL